MKRLWRPSIVCRTLTIVLGASTLTACAGSVQLDKRPVTELNSQYALPPVYLSAPCRSPTTLPQGALNAGPVERYWAQDRASLGDCRDRKAAVQDFYARRDRALSGGK